MTSTAETILEQVQKGSLSIVEAQQKLQQLKLSDLKQTTYKVSPKGCISIYGLRKMPISLYKDELIQIVEMVKTDAFQAFLSENESSLVTKVKSNK